jgi:hypothetical protein
MPPSSRHSIPIEERWREGFPDASTELFSAWATRCREIEHVAWSLADRVLKGTWPSGAQRTNCAAASQI